MKLIHLSDLHIGKRVNEFSMLEDQRYILDEILKIIDDEKPDGVIIAGDVYDRSAPAEEAVKLLDYFLTKLAAAKNQVYMISGNHDSATKLSFASKLIDISGIHISPVYNGNVIPYELEDSTGVKINIYMLPFVKPLTVKSIFPEEAIEDYTDACRVCIEHMNVEANACNILVAHQFVTGAERSESEDASVGGLDNVDASVFDDFDYVALGHIHRAQKIERNTVRYCGTPLKYSFSEINHKKSVTIIEITKNTDIKDEIKIISQPAKNSNYNISLRELELKPLRDMREIKGSLENLIARTTWAGEKTDDYIRVILTDETEQFNAIQKLRAVYPNVMALAYDNKKTRESSGTNAASKLNGKNEIEIFEEFYKQQNGSAMSEEQKKYVESLIKEIFEE